MGIGGSGHSRRLLVALACVLAGLTFPLSAWAVTEPATWVTDGVDYVNGTIAIGARCESPTVEVELWDDTGMLSTATPAPHETTVRLAPYVLRSVVTLRVVGKNVAGGTEWERFVALNPADYAPLKPILTNTVFSMVVPSSTWTFEGTAQRPVTRIEALVEQTGATTFYPQEADPTGTFAFTVKAGWGPRTRQLTAHNGFGESTVTRRRIFYLGTGLLKKTRYVYLCRKTLWAYHVYKGSVVRSWPVATGTQRTPTPKGTFRIGRPKATSGVWGAIRRPLLRYKDGDYSGSGYYIHGTNRPSSIGMPATHGCVRMYNKHIREFTKSVPNYTWVMIR